MKKNKFFLITFVAFIIGMGFLFLKPSKISEKNIIRNIIEKKEIGKQEQLSNIFKKDKVWGTLVYQSGHLKGPKSISAGYANYTKREKNSATTDYMLASLQKGYTATLIQMLIDEKKISMTTKLSQFYPEIKYSTKITIRELLDHTSGIQMGEPAPKVMLTSDASAVEWTIHHLKSTGKMYWNYSNANYTLLAGIITKVTGKSYAEILNENIIAPLKLKKTSELDNSIINNAAKTYNYGSNGVLHAMSYELVSSELGCGNLYTTPIEYFKFVSALQNNRLLSSAALNQLTRNRLEAYSGGYYYSPTGQRADGVDNGYFDFYYADNVKHNSMILMLNKGISDAQGRSMIQQIENILTA